MPPTVHVRLSSTITNTRVGSSRIDVRYDAIGNITWKSDVGSYRYGPVNNRPHAVVAVDTSTARNRNASAFNPAGNYQYNGNGALVSGAGRNVSWTSFNMPKSISGNGQNMQLTYGPEFQRVRKTESGNSDTVYFNKIYEQNTVNGAVTHKHYISAGSANIEIHKTGNQGWDTRYLHNDHIGSHCNHRPQRPRHRTPVLRPLGPAQKRQLDHRHRSSQSFHPWLHRP